MKNLKLILFLGALLSILTSCSHNIYNPITGELQKIDKKTFKKHHAIWQKPDYIVETSDSWINEGVFVVRVHSDRRKEIICVPIHKEECELKSIIKQTAPCTNLALKTNYYNP